jgi:hypothetical protein
VGVAGDRLALVIEDEGGAAEAIGDVVARVLVGEQRVGAALVGLAAQRGEDEERELAGEAWGGPGGARADAGATGAERASATRGARPRAAAESGAGSSGLGELRGALGHALVVPPDPPDERPSRTSTCFEK